MRIISVIKLGSKKLGILWADRPHTPRSTKSLYHLSDGAQCTWILPEQGFYLVSIPLQVHPLAWTNKIGRG